MIEVKNLTKEFGDHLVLNGINETIHKGEKVVVIGPSGSGKSTFLRCLNLLEEPTDGKIWFEGNKITDKKVNINLIRQKMGMVFQQFNLFQQKTALENVMEGLMIVKGLSKQEAKEIAEQQLKKVGMIERADFYPKHLSGGQQQRVAIARALAMQPELLLLDEPTSALDPELVGEVLDTIKKAAKEGNTMLLVSHEMNFVRKVADHVLFLDQGKIIESGTAEEVFEHPKQERTKQFLSTYYRDHIHKLAI